jgi:6-phosphofructokinase 1
MGFKYGFEGLNPDTSEIVKLSPDSVKDIARFGGTMLGSSRGPQDPSVMVEFLQRQGIDVLFCIGGDGTLRAQNAIAIELERRNLSISIIGIPKTIDNDISYTQRTFGFETAVDRALMAVTSAHAEARSQRNCVGLVKVMGRESGFVALYAALASPDVNLFLLPEVPFSMERVMDYITHRLETRSHCLVLVAEGAGQDLMAKSAQFDASGNIKLGDIGTFLRDEISARLKKSDRVKDGQVKYIDPSYMIRSAPANAGDSIFCQNLAHMAVHAGMCGKTSMVVGLINGQFVHLPVERVIEYNKRVDTDDLMYQLALDSTGTPRVLV